MQTNLWNPESQVGMLFSGSPNSSAKRGLGQGSRSMNRHRASKGKTGALVAVVIMGSIVELANAQMRLIPGGVFIMGTSNGKANESPEHEVALSPFSIDMHEVTNAQYDSCVAAGNCTPAHDNDGKCVAWNGRSFMRVRLSQRDRDLQAPVVCITWYQARDYCNFKGKKLPSEAQWEYAALAGGNTAYAWGNEPPDSLRCAQASGGKPKRAESFAANPWGLFDMTGNVWEWVNDRYQPDYYMTSDINDPPGSDVGQYRVIRGGGWYSGPEQLRIRNRHWFEPSFGEVSIGFRCAK
jgi:formylglycine-generating enzyme required for sulfatase activity